MNQPYIYIRSHISSLFHLPPSHPPYPTPPGGHKAQSWSPCAMRKPSLLIVWPLGKIGKVPKFSPYVYYLFVWLWFWIDKGYGWFEEKETFKSLGLVLNKVLCLFQNFFWPWKWLDSWTASREKITSLSNFRFLCFSDLHLIQSFSVWCHLPQEVYVSKVCSLNYLPAEGHLGCLQFLAIVN